MVKEYLTKMKISTKDILLKGKNMEQDKENGLGKMVNGIHMKAIG